MASQRQRIGLVRIERIIIGDAVTLLYYCGACEHEWEIVQPDLQAKQPKACR